MRHIGRVALCCWLTVMALQAAAEDVGRLVTDTEMGVLQPLFPAAVQKQRHMKPTHFAMPANYRHLPLPEAPKIFSNRKTNELQAQLQVGYAKHRFTTWRQGESVTENLYLRSYNGQIVGPTLVASPGDTLKIRMTNTLPAEQHPPHCDHGHCNHNMPHNFNTTNLHTHGLHVDPTGNSDNVFIQLGHGEAFDYEIKIPEDHPAGTYWYHSHVHGATSVQVGSGMAGALIIRGDYDRTPRLKQRDQRVILLQEIAFNEQGRIENNDTFAPTAWDDQAAQRGWHISLNGAVMPEIRLQPGEVELWRFVHAGVRKLLNLRLVPACGGEAIPLVQLAADGIPFTGKRVQDDRGVFLAPGNRGDVAVRALKRGLYYLVDSLDPHATERLPDQYCDERRGDAEFKLDTHANSIMARVVVEGSPRIMAFPSNHELRKLQRPKSIADGELAPTAQKVQFDIDVSVSPWVGLINGKPHDPSQPRVLKLGQAQTWYVSSAFSHHPFHIHVNAFEVIERDANGNIVDRYWKDTLNVPQRDPNDEAGTTKELRMRYADFTGAFVMHCHILDHGDHGMMEQVVIQP